MLEIVAVVFGLAAAVLLLPKIFNPDAPPEGRMNESLVGDRGRVVPASPSARHPLWIEVRGELWRARSDEGTLPIGTEVQILSTEGMIAVVAAAEPYEPAIPKRRFHAPSRSVRFGFACWLASCVVCWLAVGSPLYALLGVPLAWAALLGSLAVFGEI